MQFLAIVAQCVGAAVVYGIIHDQVTARVCVEYFTIGHPPVFGTDDPTLLGLGWGVIATWWVGLLLGVPLATAARAGSRPKRAVTSLLRPVAILMGVTVSCALVAGIIGWVLANHGLIALVEPVSLRVARDRHPAFLADLCTHSASYLVGTAGGIVLVVQVWQSRRRLPVNL